MFASLLAAVSSAPVGAQSALQYKRPPETATVRFGGHDKVVNVKLGVPPGVRGEVLFTISDGTAIDALTGSCSGGNDYDNRDYYSYPTSQTEAGRRGRAHEESTGGIRFVEHSHDRFVVPGHSVSIPIRLCSPSVGKNFLIHWGIVGPLNQWKPETSYDPDAPNCREAQQVIPARPFRAPGRKTRTINGRTYTYWDPGDPGRAREVQRVSWTCKTRVTVLPQSGGQDSFGLDSVSAQDEQDDPAPCDADDGVARARAAFEWHLSHGSDAPLFWRVLSTLGADDLPAKPSGVGEETVTAKEVNDFSFGKGWLGWAVIVDALALCEAAPDPDPVTPDPDPPPPVADPVVSIVAGAGVSEGGDATFTVTASPAPAAPMSVDVSVGQSGDYGVATGSRTVSVGTSGSATLTVATVNDSADEADGSVTVTVGSGAGYTVSSTAGTATVAVSDDDDPPPPPVVDPVVSIVAGAGVSEGGDATFTVTASPAPAAPMSVDVSVGQSGDYGVATGSRTVSVGTSGSATLTVATVNDSADEADGSVTVTVGSGAGYTVSSTAGTATVAVSDDDDPPPPPPPPPVNATPSFSISDASAGEGGTLTFTVTLSPSSDGFAWVRYYARPAYGSGASATYADFARTYGGLTFAVGETSKTITVASVDDAKSEGDETFKVVLYDPIQAAIADREATGTITDND